LERRRSGVGRRSWKKEEEEEEEARLTASCHETNQRATVSHFRLLQGAQAKTP